MLTEALERRRKLLGGEHPKTTKTLANLSVVLTQLGDFEAALPLAREALANRRQIFAPNHRQIGHSLYILAYIQETIWADSPRPKDVYRETHWPATARGYPAGHPFIAHSLAGLGSLLLETARGHWRLSRSCAEALAIRRQALPEGHPSIAEAEVELGRCLVKLRRLTEAEPLLLAGFERLRDEDEETARLAARALARLYGALGDADRAADFQAYPNRLAA